MPQLNKLDESLDGYENINIYKERTKTWHDKYIVKKEFQEGDFVLLFNF